MDNKIKSSILPTDIQNELILIRNNSIDYQQYETVRDLYYVYNKKNSTKMINNLIKYIAEGKITFPFSNQYMDSPKKLLENIKKYRPSINHIPFSLSKNRSLDQPKYNGQYVTISSGFENHDIMDGLTDLYTEDVRIQGRKIYSKLSTAQCWTNVDCLKSIIKQLISDKDLFKMRPKDLREAIYKVSREPGLYKITWIKGVMETIYETELGDIIPLNVEGKPLRWLDFSAGWGDRLAAAIALGFDYVGFDPNRKLYPGQMRMIQELGDINKQIIYYQPFETAYLKYITDKDGLFDIVFTSPPFFKLELYSDDQDQSVNKYPNFNTWLNNFLFVSLNKAWNGLKLGGYMVIHIDDVKEGKIIEPMKKYINENLEKSKYKGIIGLKGESGRINPVFVWKKI